MISGDVNEQDQALERNGVEKRLQLEHATGMLLTETPQIHYDQMYIAHQRFDDRAPDLAGAEQLGDPKSSVRAAAIVHCRDPFGELALVTDKQAPKAATDKGE